MAHESFEDQEVAKLLNQHFISIKVDREERPDIDAVYMNVCQALTGSGGWPLTIFMTPDQKAFFAGTYFPKENQYGRMGLISLLQLVTKKWKVNKGELVESGNAITRELARLNQTVHDKASGPDHQPIEAALSYFRNNFDKEYGGFGIAPKFPTPHNMLFLLHAYALGLGEDLLAMVDETLMAMYRGGIFDHAGYGFSRYATDQRWLIPHFEKMLYDNALLVMAYTEVYQITKRPLYQYIVERTLEYIKREMTLEDGGFFSAQDADSHGVEGKFYTWDYEEIIKLLGQEDGLLICKKYNITEAGNFEGKNILNQLHTPTVEPPDPKEKLLLKKLSEYRKTRYQLHKDDKVLTSWNGMMIAAYAKAGHVFNHPEYLEAAQEALYFLQTNLTGKDQRLRVSYRDGQAGGSGLLDDYAYLSWACLELYQSTGCPDYLEQAHKTIDQINEYFSDENGGGFFLNALDAEPLIYRPKEYYDGAVPSGNSVAAYCLVRLSRLIGEPELIKLAQKQLKACSHSFNEYPAGHSFALKALQEELYPGRELVCVVRDTTMLPRLKQMFRDLYLPQVTMHMITPENKEKLIRLVPFLQDYAKPGQEPYVFYLCHDQSCFAPIYTIKRLKEVL